MNKRSLPIATGYYVFSLLSLFVFWWAQIHFSDTNLPPLKASTRLAINLVFLNLAFSYYALIKRAPEEKLPLKIWVLWGVIGVFLCLAPPVFSGDIHEYLMRGRILGIYHLNPYQHVPAEFPNDLLCPRSTWPNNPHTYGPLFVWAQTLPAVLFKDSIPGMVWAQKVILLVFAGVGITYFSKIIRQCGFKNPELLLVSFAANPLLVVGTVIDGHNDTMMLAFMIMSVYFLLRKSYTRCFVFWSFGFLTKYTVIVLLPYLVFTAVKAKAEERKSFPWSFLLRQAAVNVALIAAAFAPFWAGKKTFVVLIEASHWFYTNTIPYAVFQALEFFRFPVEPNTIRSGFLAMYFFYYAGVLWSLIKGPAVDPKRFFRHLTLIYFLFYLGVTIPFGYHYFLWPLPWLILSRWPLSDWLLVLYSFTGLFAYWKRMNYLILLAGIVYAASLLWRAGQSGVKREAQPTKASG